MGRHFNVSMTFDVLQYRTQVQARRSLRNPQNCTCLNLGWSYGPGAVAQVDDKI